MTEVREGREVTTVGVEGEVTTEATTEATKEVATEVTTEKEEQQNVQADVEFKEFWRDSERFADLINGVFFKGEYIIRPEELVEADAEASGIVQYDTYRESMIRTRDVMKQTMLDGVRLALWGIENQKEMDKTMPLRVMVYDGQGYLKESKSEKQAYILTPIITIVLYYGKNAWTGPRFLTDMMEGVPTPIKEIVSEYKMNIVDVLHDEGYIFHNTEVKQVFEYANAIIREDEARLQELDKEYNVTKDVFYMLLQILDGDKVYERVELETKIEGGEMDMCEYFEKLVEKGRVEGRAAGEKDGRAAGEKAGRAAGEKAGRIAGAKGIVNSLREFNVAAEEIIGVLIREMNFKEEDARKFL